MKKIGGCTIYDARDLVLAYVTEILADTEMREGRVDASLHSETLRKHFQCNGHLIAARSLYLQHCCENDSDSDLTVDDFIRALESVVAEHDRQAPLKNSEGGTQ